MRTCVRACAQNGTHCLWLGYTYTHTHTHSYSLTQTDDMPMNNAYPDTSKDRVHKDICMLIRLKYITTWCVLSFRPACEILVPKEIKYSGDVILFFCNVIENLFRNTVFSNFLNSTEETSSDYTNNTICVCVVCFFPRFYLSCALLLSLSLFLAIPDNIPVDEVKLN